MTTTDQLRAPAVAVPARHPATPHRCASCISGSATSIARIRPGTPRHAGDAADWGIAAFTGRRPDAADALAPQDGLSTLITRASDGDTFEVIGSLTAVHAAAEHDAYLDYLRRPEVAVVTITVTEQGYLADP